MNMKNHLFKIFSFALIILTLSITSCKKPKTQEPTLEIYDGQSEWAKDKTIYEVNLRQFSEEGTFNKFSEDLERIKDMGMDILWFMPIHPISVERRKEGLGSYYSVADYRGVNPEHGTLEDFKNLVNKAHEMEMYVILDWVPNHTGWDHPWITEHPEYYTKNAAGEITDPINPETNESWGWTDVADLDYDNPEMRAAMIEDMRFWLTECGVDGFRMDVAHGVPQDFWKTCNASLRVTNPGIFLLAEAEIPRLVNSGGFETTYAWNYKSISDAIGTDTVSAAKIDEYLKNDRDSFQQGYHIYFTSNHDENTWHGTVFDRLGDNHKPLAVLAATLDGMPLVYSGQEEPIKKRLKFFEKDVIEWENYAYHDFYKTLMTLKKRNRALWNGKYGGEPIKIQTGNDKKTYAFIRERNGDKVFVILNLSADSQSITLLGQNYAGTYTDVFSKQKRTIKEGETMVLEPRQYIVLSNK